MSNRFPWLSTTIYRKYQLAIPLRLADRSPGRRVRTTYTESVDQVVSAGRVLPSTLSLLRMLGSYEILSSTTRPVSVIAVIFLSS
jgi:hypothetical protein